MIILVYRIWHRTWYDHGEISIKDLCLCTYEKVQRVKKIRRAAEETKGICKTICISEFGCGSEG